jgi:hypothetical protein
VNTALEAAIVGGSAALAVVLTEWLTRIRTRTDEVRRATRDIIISLPYVTVAIGEHLDPVDTSIGSPWSERQERVTALLGLIDTSARWPQRHARRIRADFWSEGLRLPRDMLLDISAVGLRQAVFGSRQTLEKEIDSYRRGSVGRLPN